MYIIISHLRTRQQRIEEPSSPAHSNALLHRKVERLLWSDESTRAIVVSRFLNGQEPAKAKPDKKPRG
jgi:hypothetical protein